MKEESKKIELIPEFSLSDSNREAISQLLIASFPAYPKDRIFYPQPPHFRLLHWYNQQLTGHLAGIIRAIRIGGQSLSIYGLADLCTDQDWSGTRIANSLIGQVELLAQKNAIPFLMTMASSPEFYEKAGFQLIDTRCKWLAFMDGNSLGLFQRNPPSGLMVKSTSTFSWPSGEVDLMGPLF
jgi:hypothetical protein